MSDNEEFVWEAPPEDYVRSKYMDAIEKVKTRPGRWARIKLGSSSSAQSGRTRVLTIVKDDPHWECIVRRIGKEQYGLWLRYRTEEQMKAANGGD